TTTQIYPLSLHDALPISDAHRPLKHPKVAFRSQFCGSVGREWSWRCRLWRGQTAGMAVDGSPRGREHEPTATGIDGRFQHRDGADDIEDGIACRIAKRAGDTALGREVEDDVGPECDDGGGRLGRGDIDARQLDALGQWLAAPMAEVVDDQDQAACRCQSADGMDTNESGASGHQDASWSGHQAALAAKIQC